MRLVSPPQEIVNAACKDIKNRMSLADVVKKYHVSLYYAKKWTSQVYKDMDLSMYVRRRYCDIICEARENLETVIQRTSSKELADALTDNIWDSWDSGFKKVLYDMVEKITRAN